MFGNSQLVSLALVLLTVGYVKSEPFLLMKDDSINPSITNRDTDGKRLVMAELGANKANGSSKGSETSELNNLSV